ncbi:LuxR C-terminal-related transcriptional regulator [Streptomyces sp. Je 1-79]|uniref:helix-turn-helix transcriptional regulator n=1 Tax=Streptomyces sp. Je 1-79 TaxID=2943847 RepID=UPI0021A62329|nr:LuxR C-terminal-related transcriptional regulator [Streptomyces sp. Je 1-79]MCT4352168.1 LuxR C-terminal-related transcriptional regulator [Streptomyces sp. Je 1-79]
MPERIESVELRAALLRMRRTTGLEVVFGGLLHDGRRLRIAELNGALTPALRGLAISTGSGLGGKCLALSRPCAVVDYPSARHITHEYDGPVSAEGLRSVIAVPVVVRRKVRGVLYGALRDARPLGERVLDAAVAAARDVEQALAVRDEVRDLLAASPGTGRTGPGRAAGRGAGQGAGPGGGPGHGPGDGSGPGVGPSWEEVRQAHGELRELAPRIADPELRARLLAVCGRLETASVRPERPPGVSLTPRELDVLAAVAAGATNATAAERLGLRPETVKGYLRSTMRKLGAHTRLEAVVAARRAGLLP